MTLFNADDILNIAEYEKIRPTFRKEVMEVKKPRRLHLGEHMTILLENKMTMLYQIQEMMRTERIVDERAIQHEIDTYSKLATTKECLKASLLIEYPDKTTRPDFLRGLLGFEKHLFLDIGEDKKIQAQFDASQVGDTQISSVQYIEFPIDSESRDLIIQAGSDGKPVRLYATHPNYTAEITLSPDQVGAIVDDLKA